MTCEFSFVSLLIVLEALSGVSGSDASSLPPSRRAAVEKWNRQTGSQCDFAIINASGMSATEFGKLMDDASRGPMVFESVDGLEELMRGVKKEEVMPMYKDSRVSLEAGIDESRSNFRLKIEEIRPIKEYIYNSTGGQELIFELGNFGEFGRGLWKDKQDSFPAFVKNSMANPMTTLGNLGSGTNMHRHRESWLLQLHGRKAWWIGPPSSKYNTYFGTFSPCAHLGAEAPPGFQFCVQQPGQMVYFHSQYWHATCNIDDFTWGVGGQGRTLAWPDLIVKAGEGNLSAVQKQLAADVETGSITRSMYAAVMHRSLIFSRTDIADELLRYAPKLVEAPLGPAIDEHFTQSPVHAAIIVGDVARTKKLLHAGWSSEDPWSSAAPMLPLEMAARLGHRKLVEIFAEKEGSKFSAEKDDLLPTFLNGAAVDGHLSVVKYLHSIGGELDEGGNLGQQPVHVAAAGGQVHVVKFILGKRKKLVNSLDDDGNTPAHAASENGHKAVLQFLVAKKATLHIANKKGMQPLHLAAEQGHVNVVRYLLDAKADVRDDVRGATALHFAAGTGAYDVAEFLVGRRADVRALAGGNVQPLHIAALMGGGRFIVELLVHQGASLDARTLQGETPLSMAQQRGHIPTASIIEHLMDGVDHDSEDEAGDSARKEL